MTCIGLQCLCIVEDPLDAISGYFIPSPADRTHHAVIHQFADVFGYSLGSHPELRCDLLLPYGWLVFGDPYKDLETGNFPLAPENDVKRVLFTSCQATPVPAPLHQESGSVLQGP